MKTANVSTLRARLSEFLDAVRGGETIEVLDRKVAIARIVPVEPTSRSKRGLPPWLERRRRAGVIRVGPMKGVSALSKGAPPGPPNTGALDALLEDRRAGR